MSSVPVNIVVIEDDTQIRYFIHTALTTEGWQVHEAATLKQGRFAGRQWH